MRYTPIMLLLPALAHGMASVPAPDMSCKEEYFPNPSTIYLRCTFPRNGSRYNSSNALADQVGVILIPRNPAHKVKLRIHMDGYQPDLTGWPTWNGAEPDYAVMKVLPGHYPKLTDYPGQPLDWSGVFNGELSQSWRIEALLWYVAAHFGNQIDWGAGLICNNRSYGAAGCAIQSLVMPDAFTKAIITVNHGDGGPTNFVGVNPLGNYWRDPHVQLAWQNFDYTKADPYLHSDPRVYDRLNGGDNDEILTRNTPQYAEEVCEKLHKPCFLTYHHGRHSTDQAGVNLPFYATYACAGMSHRLDQPQIAITGSTANRLTGDIGWYNLGMCWLDSGMIDTPTHTVIPIRYLRWTAIAVDVPDQPESVTFDATIRNTKLQLHAGDIVHYTLGDESGEALVTKDGEVTLPYLTLNSSTTYSTLTITRL